MPELPDIVIYIAALSTRILNQSLQRVRIAHPFLLPTAEPPLSSVEDKRVVKLKRIGKRIAIGLENELWLLIHLMIAGRFHWRDPGAALRGKGDLAAFDFANGSLVLTEAGTKKRASLHVLENRTVLEAHDPGGIDVLQVDLETFSKMLARNNHTLKRGLTDPHLFSASAMRTLMRYFSGHGYHPSLWLKAFRLTGLKDSAKHLGSGLQRCNYKNRSISIS